MNTTTTSNFVSIQERSKNKALNAFDDIEQVIDEYVDKGGKVKFDMFK